MNVARGKPPVGGSRRFSRFQLLASALGLIVAAASAGLIARAFYRTGPYLEITGHYADARAPLLQAGSAPSSHLRLTEPDVDDLEGWLVPSRLSFSYYHAAPASPAYIPLARDVLAGAVEINTGDAIGDGIYLQPIQFFDAIRFTLKTRDGDYFVIVPARDGAVVPLVDRAGGRVWIAYCNSRLYWSAGGDCSGLTPFASTLLAGTGRMIHVYPPPAGASWLADAHVVFKSREKKAFMLLGRGQLTSVMNPLALDLRVATGPFAVWKRAGSDRVFVSRTGPAGQAVHVLRGKEWRNVGFARNLPYGTVLVLGTTAFRVEREGDVIRLVAVERRDRFHFFPSLSSGRLNFTNRVYRFRERDSLEVVGVAEGTRRAPVSATVRSSGEIETVPLPLAAQPAAPPVSSPTTPMLLATVRTFEIDDLVGVNAPRTGPHAPPHGMTPAVVRNGEAFLLGGHVLEYHNEVPRYEQLVPPAIFALLAVAAVVIITIATRRKGDGEDLDSDIVRGAVAIATGIIAVLMVAGVSLMSHMAAVHTLVGKADYYHRQLFYSFVTLALVAAILIRDRAAKNPLAEWRSFFPISMRVLVAYGITLVAVHVVDLVAFHLITGELDLASGPVQDAISRAATIAIFTLALYSAAVASTAMRSLIAAGCMAVAGILLFAFGYLTAAMLVLAVLLLPAAVWARKKPRALRLYREPWSRAVLLILGASMLVLSLGVSSARGGGGVKPSEFAIWFLAIAMASLLSERFRPASSDAKTHDERRLVAGALVCALLLLAAVWNFRYMWGRVLVWTLPPLALIFVFRLASNRVAEAARSKAPRSKLFDSIHTLVVRWRVIIMILLVIEVLLAATYATAGDFGPLLVLMPALALVVMSWSFAPDEDKASRAGRFAALGAVGAALVWMVASGALFVASEWALRFKEESVSRAAKRFTTFAEPWYTKEGAWSVSAKWLADGFYGEREPMIANLHSDLAFIAALRTFGRGIAAWGLLGCYFVIIVLSLACAWVVIRRSAKIELSTDATPAEKIVTMQRALHSRQVALMLIFAAFYLELEIAVHIASAFNAFPQTGVTLPWISSGGSAAVAFAGLLAIVFAHAIKFVEGETP